MSFITAITMQMSPQRLSGYVSLSGSGEETEKMRHPEGKSDLTHMQKK
jgi:hypothetical protein